MKKYLLIILLILSLTLFVSCNKDKGPRPEETAAKTEETAVATNTPEPDATKEPSTTKKLYLRKKRVSLTRKQWN